MRTETIWKLLRAAVVGVPLASCTAYGMGVYGMTANDTGGMIPWSPVSEPVALQIANDHCARYGRYAIITSVHPWPGDYIGFACRIPGRWGPVLR